MSDVEWRRLVPVHTLATEIKTGDLVETAYGRGNV
jgi:hypothetical protein